MDEEHLLQVGKAAEFRIASGDEADDLDYEDSDYDGPENYWEVESGSAWSEDVETTNAWFPGRRMAES